MEGKTHLTSPNSSSFALVSSVNGVEAMIHTSPVDNLIAVERPPVQKTPSRVKGLWNRDQVRPWGIELA